ncbi:hypothetical protein J4227_04900 [Candidatus Woesearchaeota archaeon]|nr:hypothetical protein [Candidatus Woesearchaeota archaeon]
MDSRGLREVAAFMIALIISLPFYSSFALGGGNIRAVEVYGSEDANFNNHRDSNVMLPDDYIVVRTHAVVDEVAALKKGYLAIYLPTTLLSYGGAGESCANSVKYPGYMMCDYAQAPVSTWSPGENEGYVNLYQELSRAPETLIASQGFYFYVDTQPPVMSIKSATQLIPPGYLSITYNDGSGDRAFSGATGQECAGLNEVRLTIAEADDPVSSEEYTQDLADLNTGCSQIPAGNKTLRIPRTELISDFGAEFSEEVSICVDADDKLGQAQAQSCLAGNYFLDLKTPKPVPRPGGFEKSIGTVIGDPISSTDYVSFGQAIVVKANFTDDEGIANPLLDANYLNIDEDELRGAVRLTEIAHKYELTWQITVGTGDKTKPMGVKVADLKGNEFSDADFWTLSEMPQDELDNSAPVIKGIMRKGTINMLKATENSILVLLNDSDPLELSGVSGFGDKNVHLEATSPGHSVVSQSIKSCAQKGNSVPGVWECEFENVEVAGSDGSIVVFTVTGADDAGNPILQDAACAELDGCEAQLDNLPPSFVQIPEITNLASLSRGGKLKITTIARDETSGILPETGNARAYAKGPDCHMGTGEGIAATTCEENPGYPGEVTCTWGTASTGIGTVDTDCFGKQVYINIFDVAGNNESASVTVAASQSPYVDDTLIISNHYDPLDDRYYINRENNTISSTISASLISDVERVTANFDAYPNPTRVYEQSANTGGYRAQWYGDDDASTGMSLDDMGAGGIPDGNPFTVEISAVDDFGNGPGTGDADLYVDKTAPKFKSVEIVNSQDDFPQSVRRHSVRITAKIEEALSGISPGKTMLRTKDLNKNFNEGAGADSYAEADSCTMSAIEADTWECVWNFQNYNPESGNPPNKLYISTEDVAGNYKHSQQDNVFGLLEVYREGGAITPDQYWIVNVDDETGVSPKSINRNLLKPSFAPQNGFRTKIVAELSEDTGASPPPDLEVFLFRPRKCTSEQYPGQTLGTEWSVNNYIGDASTGEERHKIFFTLKLPALEEDWLKDEDNTEIKVNCQFEITNGDATQVYTNSVELENESFTFTLRQKIGVNIGQQNFKKIADHADEIETAKRWANNFKKILDFIVPACKAGAMALMISATASLVAGWMPFIGDSIRSVFFFAWKWWSPIHPLDVYKVKFWCEMATCQGSNIAGVGMSAMGVDTVLPGGVPVAGLLAGSPDPRENIWLSSIQIPTCLTGFYTYFQMKKTVLTAEDYCIRQQALMGKDMQCQRLSEEFSCIYSNAGSALIQLLASAVMSYITSLVVNYLVQKIMEAIGGELILCPTGGLAYEPYCYLYAMLDAGNYLDRISDTQDMINRYEGLDSAAAAPLPDMATPPDGDICGLTDC